MSEDVPASMRSPVAIPAEDAGPGGYLYEPKWDGYLRCTLQEPVPCTFRIPKALLVDFLTRA